MKLKQCADDLSFNTDANNIYVYKELVYVTLQNSALHRSDTASAVHRGHIATGLRVAVLMSCCFVLA